MTQHTQHTQLDVKVYIVIIAIDFATGIKYALGVYNEEYDLQFLPYGVLTKGTNIHTIVEQLCQKHFDLDMSWVNPTLFEVSNNNEELSIYFTGIIPLDTHLKKARFEPINPGQNNPVIIRASRTHAN